MKKTLIVAAVSALAAGSALAQSSVTIYGRLNVTAESLDRAGLKTKELVNNASRLGFKGVEDLGGGLKANFLLEHRFNVDTGTVTGAFYAGDSYVGLSGGFGAVRLGRITSEAYYATADYISMNNHDTGTSADALYAYIGNNRNKIAYNTNSLGGLVLHASIGAGEGVAAAKVLDLAATYELGDLSLGFGYEKNNASANQYAVRALYTAGPVVVGGYIQKDKNGYGTNVGSRTTFRLTGAYNVGSSEFHVGYGKAGDYSRVNDSDVSQLVLGYNYNLSKRTRIHTHYTKVSASRNATFYATDLTALGVGIRHNF
ncbi:porin [Rubrivivax rivuli]|uniref:Porin n=1 Tax=Rubrivivax rivuli TaxID=1862385 RepID=A0A437REK6_9BURK|nr:porin [Rubrivivax rivuli]RVU45162.1 porin [Rubrivivax rivuli]